MIQPILPFLASRARLDADGRRDAGDGVTEAAYREELGEVLAADSIGTNIRRSD